MQISPINNSYQQSFGKLKNIHYVQSSKLCREINSTFFEQILIGNELRKLAKINTFFKDYDVSARVNAKRGVGSFLTLNCKPAANSFKEKVKNFFSMGEKIKIESNAACPEDSAYEVAKKIRKIDKKNELYDMLKNH